ncbi:MAG: hypothetical protein R3F14_35085 [Polyangiaceae bacterium]
MDFIHGDIEETAPPVDAYYLFNPFSDTCGAPGGTATPSRARSGTPAGSRQSSAAREAPTGTFVITYNGFGGDMPPLPRGPRGQGLSLRSPHVAQGPRRDRPG